MINDVDWDPVETSDQGDDSADARYYSDDAATLGDRIAAARQAAGLRQAELAARIGVGVKVVSGWENDRSEPRANRLSMLAGMLNVSVAWLLMGAGEGVEPPERRERARGDVRPIQLSLVTPDLEKTRRFYADMLGCRMGPGDDAMQVIDLFGHRLRAHLGEPAPAPRALGEDGAPAPSVAVTLSWTEWRALVERLRAQAADFAVEPSIRAVGAPEEEGLFYLSDPSGAAVGFHARRRSE